MVNPFDLSGRTAIVTGALGKLGLHWTSSLLEAGARVVALDLPGIELSREFSALIQRSGTRATVIRADVLDRPSLDRALAECKKTVGAPDVLVNNAGIDQPPEALKGNCALDRIPLDVNRAVFDVNVLGLFQCCQVFGGDMAARGKGAIINIGSLYAEVSPDARLYDHLGGDPPWLKPPAYGASKAAVVGITRYLATHWAGRGVRVNALSPGGVAGAQDAEFKRKYADRVPMGRMAEPGDLAGPLLFLASDASSYVTGINLVVDGGYTAW